MIFYTRTKSGVEDFIEVQKLRLYPDRAIVIYSTLDPKDRDEERVDLKMMSAATLGTIDLLKKI